MNVMILFTTRCLNGTMFAEAECHTEIMVPGGRTLTEVDLEAHVDRIRSCGSDLRSRRFPGVRGAADDRRSVLGQLRQRETRVGGRPVGERSPHGGRRQDVGEAELRSQLHPFVREFRG